MIAVRYEILSFTKHNSAAPILDVLQFVAPHSFSVALLIRPRPCHLCCRFIRILHILELQHCTNDSIRPIPTLPPLPFPPNPQSLCLQDHLRAWSMNAFTLPSQSTSTSLPLSPLLINSPIKGAKPRSRHCYETVYLALHMHWKKFSTTQLFLAAFHTISLIGIRNAVVPIENRNRQSTRP